MTAVGAETGAPTRDAVRPAVLVWIDAEQARIVRWRDDEARLERVRSDVPGRRRSTGHVRHDPRIRHGGGGTPQSAGEPRRLERLARFVERVADRIDAGEDVLLLGPGTVPRRLERVLHAAVAATAEARQDGRTVTVEAAGPLTDPQLVARVRSFVGEAAERRIVGR